MSQDSEVRVTPFDDLLPLVVPSDSRPQSADDSAMATIASIVAVQRVNFDIEVTSGSPGRSHESNVFMSGPVEAGSFVVLSQFRGAFVTSDGAFVTERPLGAFSVQLGFPNPNPNRQLICRVQLTDSNQDDPIHITVVGLIVYYT